MLIKGILSFPALFKAKIAKGASVAKYSVGILLPPTDPQVALIQAEVDAAKLNTFPSGYTGTDECLGLYENRVTVDKAYYDPRFTGWYLFTCNVKEDVGRPSVVDLNLTQVIDPGAVFSGMVGYVNAGISGYTTGRGGVGGWLNGVMITPEEPPMGRLDNKPSVEQMFAAVPGTVPMAPAPMAPAPMAPAPMAPAPMAPAPLQMTSKANGITLEQYLATQGWTEQMLLDQGLAIRPSFA